MGKKLFKNIEFSFWITLNEIKISRTLYKWDVWLIVAWWRHMATEIWVNIGSGNGLSPDGTKPLPEPMLTYQ